MKEPLFLEETKLAVRTSEAVHLEASSYSQVTQQAEAEKALFEKDISAISLHESPDPKGHFQETSLDFGSPSQSQRQLFDVPKGLQLALVSVSGIVEQDDVDNQSGYKPLVDSGKSAQKLIKEGESEIIEEVFDMSESEMIAESEMVADSEIMASESEMIAASSYAGSEVKSAISSNLIMLPSSIQSNSPFGDIPEDGAENKLPRRFTH
jgi:hypothetical protein